MMSFEPKTIKKLHPDKANAWPEHLTTNPLFTTKKTPLIWLLAMIQQKTQNSTNEYGVWIHHLST